MKNTTFIGIGSNLGDKIGNCESAINRIGDCKENRILHCSSFYRTEPVGYVEQDFFVNCVIKLETALAPDGLLRSLKKLESAFGRRKTVVWGPRMIDLDILLFNREEFSSKDLRIPHPRLHERAFVLVPLCEIDPEVVHPSLNATARKLLESLGRIGGVERI